MLISLSLSYVFSCCTCTVRSCMVSFALSAPFYSSSIGVSSATHVCDEGGAPAAISGIASRGRAQLVEWEPLRLWGSLTCDQHF